MSAARREVEEEIGTRIRGRFERVGDDNQRGGKIVIAWSVEADVDIDVVAIASIVLRWRGPGRARCRSSPEVDRAGWFSLAEANGKILEGAEGHSL
jgi:predicted NUDIX family NTP pyrophosphohydrolase